MSDILDIIFNKSMYDTLINNIEDVFNYNHNNNENINLNKYFESVKIVVDELHKKMKDEVERKIKIFKEILNYDGNNNFKSESKLIKIKTIEKNFKKFNLIYPELVKINKLFYIFIFYQYYLNYSNLSQDIINDVKNINNKDNIIKISKEWKYSYIKFLSNLIAFINENQFNTVIDLTLNFTCNLIFIYQKHKNKSSKMKIKK